MSYDARDHEDRSPDLIFLLWDLNPPPPKLRQPVRHSGGGRISGHGSRKYSGPRQPGRRRPDPAALAKSWRKAREA